MENKKDFGEKRGKEHRFYAVGMHFLRLVKGLRLTEDEVWGGAVLDKKEWKNGVESLEK